MSQLPVADKLVAELKRRIASGAIKPHAHLPSQRALAKEFRTSCRSVSEAIYALSEEGLIMCAPGRGARVVPPIDRLSRSVVGIVHRISQGQTSPQVACVLQGVLSTLDHLGYRSVVTPIEVSPQEKRCLPGSLVWPPDAASLRERFGALIFIETFHCEQQLLDLEDRKVPLVIANLTEDMNVSCTCVDYHRIVRQSIRLLAALGHRRIGLLSRAPGTFFYGKTIESYKAQIADMGIPLDESLIALTVQSDGLAAYLAAKPLLEQANPPTAVICGRDRLAHGLYQAMRERGMVPGKDLSIISYDNLTWPEGQGFLTTFHEPCVEMGRQAAEMLADRVVHGWRPPEKRVLETPLVLRQSVGLAPNVERATPIPSSPVMVNFAD